MQTSKIVLHNSQQNHARRKKEKPRNALDKAHWGVFCSIRQIEFKGSSKIVGTCHFITMGGDTFDEWWKLFVAGIMDPPDLDGLWTLKFEQF
jgi:hypothetical protein